MREIYAIAAIAHRDFVKLLRDRVRIVADFALPLVFILLLGPMLQAGFGSPDGLNLQTFVFTGVVAQTVWQSSALGVISLIADREEDFSQEIFVSPISRYSIVIGKIIGESLVALPQGLALIAIGLSWLLYQRKPLEAGQRDPLKKWLGLLILSNISSQRAANQIFPFVMLPQFFLAGVFNPIHGLPPILDIASRLAPMRYAVELLRNVYYGAQPTPATPAMAPGAVNLGVIAVSFLAFFAVGTALFVRAERNR